MTGIRLPDDAMHYYTLDTGLDECRLERWGIGADGRGNRHDERDLRGEASLETLDFGTIQFRRRRPKSQLSRVLADILKFAEQCGVAEIVKVVN